ncbi:hypothetical protein M3J09_013176 [Ascochyta lentis]
MYVHRGRRVGAAESQRSIVNTNGSCPVKPKQHQPLRRYDG